MIYIIFLFLLIISTHMFGYTRLLKGYTNLFKIESGIYSDVSDTDYNLIESTQATEFKVKCLGEQVETDMYEIMPKEVNEESAGILTDKEIDEIKNAGIPTNTRKRNSWSINTFRNWAINRNNHQKNVSCCSTDKFRILERDLQFLDKEQMVYWICKFICEVRKKDGSVYQPNTLLSLVMGLQSYLNNECNIKVEF